MLDSMHDKLQKAINLARRTGDRLIVFDRLNSDNPFVVMSLDEYEKMAIGRSEVRGLTEDELLDRINRDVAIWKSEQELNNWPQASDFRPDTEFNMFGPERRVEEIKTEDKPKSRLHWAIPNNRKEAAEEIIEEDKQYLEEIKF